MPAHTTAQGMRKPSAARSELGQYVRAESTPDRDGRSREERISVLPTIMSSSPGKSPAPSQQRPAIGRPSRKPEDAAMLPSGQRLPRVNGGGDIGPGTVITDSKTHPVMQTSALSHQGHHEADHHATEHTGGDQDGNSREADEKRVHAEKQRSGADNTLKSLKDKESMQQFLEFRKKSKQRTIEKLVDMPARTQEMMRDLFYPPTPDISLMLKRSSERLPAANCAEPVIFPHERALYKRFQKFCRGSSMMVEKEGKEIAASLSEGEASTDEADTAPRTRSIIDLRGFVAFVKHLRLIPQQKKNDPIPLQYAVTVQCFKRVQEGTTRSLNFPECKEVIFQLLRRGPEMLEEEQKKKKIEIDEMHQKIARMVPNCENPLAEVKRVFSQIFDSIFEAFIFFDVSGDWTCTQVEFIQYCKMLQLPLTAADLQIAMSHQCHMEELDSMSFVRNFRWYPLVEKPKFWTMGYTVKPSENKLYQVFSWVAAGTKAERILEMIDEQEKLMHAALIEKLQTEERSANLHDETEEEDRANLHDKAFDVEEAVSLTRVRSLTKMQPIGESLQSPQIGSDDQMSPTEADKDQSSHRTADKDEKKDRGNGMSSPAPQSKESMFFSEVFKAVADSSERSMTFQDLIEFLKVVDLIPVHLHRPGGKLKADLSSAEFNEVLRIFRSILGKEKKLEWPEFKHLLYELLTSKALHKDLEQAEYQLKNMRNALARYAPSSDAPLEAFKEALSVRFNSSVDAFVFFDIQGDWSVTQAEVQNMIKRLQVPLSKPDLEGALEALFIASHGGGINANEFVRRLKWQKDDVRKVKEVFDIYAYERRLFNEFKRWCDISGVPGTASTPGTSASMRSAKVVELESARNSTAGSRRKSTAQSGRIGKSSSGHVQGASSTSRPQTFSSEIYAEEETDVEPEEYDVTCSSRMSFDGFEGFIRAIRLLVPGSSIEELHLELLRKAFETCNWAGDTDNLISWVEFKHALHVYLLNLPTWLEPYVDEYQNEMNRKRKELHEKVVTFQDPISDFSKLLATRFDDVFDAFVFFDMDGDWQITNREMHKMLPKLQLKMTRADLDVSIGKIMREINYKNEFFVDPQKFCKSLAWHPKPSTAPALKRALEAAKLKRAETLERAISAGNQGGDVEDSVESLSILPDDSKIVSHLQKQTAEIQRLQRDLKRIRTFFGIPFDGRMGLEEEDIQRRREIARQDLHHRELQQSDKGISQLLDKARLRRYKIEEEAIKRSQDDVYSRKLNGFKHGVREPPAVEVLLKWVPKNDRLELASLVQTVKRLKAAIHRFQIHGKKVFNTHIKDLAISTKELHKRQEMFAHNREMKKLAIEGEHHIILDGLDDAKLRRRSITEKTLKRAEVLQANEWGMIEFPSKSVMQALKWFEVTARQRVIGLEGQEKETKVTGHGDLMRKAQINRPLPADWGAMGPARMEAAATSMTKALQYRFPTIYDAWCFLDPDSKWNVSASEFRKRAAFLRLPEEPVDIEGVFRKLDSMNQESVGPLDFVNLLKWHELGSGVSELRASFDTATKRRVVVAQVAIRRSRDTPDQRPAFPKTTVIEEVGHEVERQRKDRLRKLEAENFARQQKLREMYGPPQIIKDYARARDWKRLLDLEVDVVRLAVAMDHLRVSAHKGVLDLNCNGLSLQYYQACAPLHDIPMQQRDNAACMIQRSLRALTAWRTKPHLKRLKAANATVWGFGRGEVRSEVVGSLRRAAEECGCMMLSAGERYTEHGDAQALVLEALAAAEAHERKVRQDMLTAQEEIQRLEQWAIAEIKLLGSKTGGRKNILVRHTAEAVCILMGESDVEWENVLRVLNRRTFIQELQSLDTENIEDFRFHLLMSTYDQSILAADFVPAEAGKAAEPLCAWVRCICDCKTLARYMPHNATTADQSREQAGRVQSAEQSPHEQQAQDGVRRAKMDEHNTCEMNYGSPTEQAALPEGPESKQQADEAGEVFA